MMKYDFKATERKWQSKWREQRAFAASDDRSLPKYYVLVEFPYPSGEGLHIGHPRSYVGLDVVARKRRMQGYNVLYPMGWDAFGLPAENYAIKTGENPRDVTHRNIANFRRVMDSLGLSFDWTREINTTDPEYYKWTQWTFLKMWEHDLAYKARVSVNWCDSCKVGLANEEVVAGRCERCGGEVRPKRKEQWMLRITAYADRLLRDLDTVEYLAKIRTQQVNWIGRSEGAEVDFRLVREPEQLIRVFTTRPDTLYGVSFLALAPDSELIDKLLPLCQNQEEVQDYVQDRVRQSVSDREVPSEPTGVALVGVTACNPVNSVSIPVWVSDYVLSSYGTGAIMAVPAHDERDWRFARRFGLPVVEVVSGGNASTLPFTNLDGGTLVNSGFLNGLSPGQAIGKMIAFLEENGFGRARVQYKLRDWVFSRQRYWGEPIPMVFCKSCGWVPLPESQLPLVLPEIDSYHTSATGESPLALLKSWVNTRCPKCHGPGRRETDTMPQWSGSSWYFLRYCDPHNAEAIAERERLDYWMPVDWYNGGMEHTTLHLLYSRFWHKFLYDIGVVPTSEPYRKRTSHGMVLGENGEKMSKSRGNVINPGDIIEEHGADALRLFEVFMGEFDQSIPWSTHGLIGMSRFLQRVWKLQERVRPAEPDAEMNRLLHQTIKDVEERVEATRFNTAVAALMELANRFSMAIAINPEHWEVFLKLLAPFAPHIAEELWERHGKSSLLCGESWPRHDPSLILTNIVDVVVQVDGKLRNRISLAQDATDQELQTAAISVVRTYVQDRTITRIVVARRTSSILVNLVTKDEGR